MQRLLSAVVVCLVTSIATASAQAATSSHRVIGGNATSIQTAPWQVAVFAAPPGTGIGSFDPNPPPEAGTSPFSFECAGVILDATHVLTSAHCVQVTASDAFSSPFDRQHFSNGSWTYGVAAGTSFLSAGDSQVESTLVSKVARDPMYDGANYDVAIMTLADPLSLDGVNRAAIGLSNSLPATGAALSTTGWGSTTNGTELTDALQVAPVQVSDFHACQTAYGAMQTALTTTASICAAGVNPVTGDCPNDSGGALVDASTPAHLVGIYSTGQGCANAAYPGVYTPMANDAVQQFINAQTTGPDPGAALSLTGPLLPWLSGTLKVGDVLTCTPGNWANNIAYKFTFFDPNAGVQLQTATGLSATYTVLPSDTGRDIACSVRAANIDQALTYKSNPVGPATTTGAPGQTQTPTPTTTTTTTKNTQKTVITQRDTTKPRAVVTSSKCSSTSCVLHVAAQDNGFSAGIASLRGTVRTTVSKRCGKHTCTKTVTKSLTIKKLKTNGYFLVTASKLPRGKHRFSLTAVDSAGNKQTKATVKTLTTGAARSVK